MKYLTVVGVLESRIIRIPVLVMVTNIGTQNGFQSLLVSLYLLTGLRVACGGEDVCSFE